MLNSVKENIQFLLILVSWLIAGAFGGLAAYIIIPAFLFLLLMNERYQELFLGFLFILIISDNLEPAMGFAKGFKNLHILLFSLFFFARFKDFKTVNRLFVLFIPYFIVAIFCLLYAQANLMTGIQKTLSYILLFLTVPNYVSHIYRMRGNDFLKDLLTFLIMLIIIGFLFRFVNADVAFSHGGRLRGVFGNPNGLGIFVILVFILYTAISHYNPSMFAVWEKRFIFLLLLYITYKTGSRTALVAILLFMVFARFYRYSPFLGFIVFLATLFATEFFMNNYAMIITAMGLQDVFRLDTLEAGSGRTIAWEFAWKEIQKSIFFGKGFAFDENLMRSNFDYLSRQGHEGGVHNTYLIIWLNTGLIGLLAFLRGFILIFIRASKNSNFAIPAMFTIMFSINFEPWLAASLNPFTILFLTLVTVLTDEVIIAGREIGDFETENNMKIKNEEAKKELA